MCITPTADATPDSGIGPVVTPNWHVATDEGFATAVASGSVVASVSSDHIAKIDVTGLDSSTTDCPAANVRKPIDGLISIYARCTPLLRGLLECET
ncbi:PhoD-like phosphatase N-terminal domain-containing protein [Rhodococcus erythropolis]|uniref:PhoD-like phosphatase N-terminal domain-containing protein n=1 Tax=Rhodococcus erythropolis TaxID=1833 RepID=UPI0022260377|nr:PhoD-like phosphatase N-terminal domain-containing protein [Rhodococcus erythropolis]